MKRFLNLVITNMANSLKPMIILAVITIVVQVGLYSFSLFARDDYKENELWMEDIEEEDIICENPVEFLDETYCKLFNVVTIVSVVVSIMLVKSNSREKDNKISIIRLLPVKRSTLFRAKAVSNGILVVGCYFINIACIGISYILYNAILHEKFRAARIRVIDDTNLMIMLIEVIVLIIWVLIQAAGYTKKAYSIYSK